MFLDFSFQCGYRFREVWVCWLAGAPVMPRTARLWPIGGVSPTTSPLTCCIAMSGTTFQVRGEPGLHGTNPGKYWHHTHPLPHLVQSLVVGVGRHPAEQCSTVESSKSQGPVRDLIGTMDRWGHWSQNELSSFCLGSTAPCSADCRVSSSSLSSAPTPLLFHQWTTFRVRGEPGSRGTNPGKFWHHTHPLPHLAIVPATKSGKGLTKCTANKFVQSCFQDCFLGVLYIKKIVPSTFFCVSEKILHQLYRFPPVGFVICHHSENIY